MKRIYNAVNALIDITQKININQKIPPNIIIRKNQEGGSTLDLIFINKYLAERIFNYDIDETV